ncbi:hypothetical protein NQ315_015599 [Exocentrus adspersus]|uniref:Endonuclease/exonuclease/phosphatase n=1 Tax=Exocentrus adspersus TaxID=1586481 RepID=A0AAV8VF00_9CUCU|nr:hypothetical protein NQ315_015599 [Exocentrus adspersus]
MSKQVDLHKVTDCISMSDHRMIRFELRSEPEDPILRRNPRSTDWAVFLGNLRNSVKKSNQSEHITSTRQLNEKAVRRILNRAVKGRAYGSWDDYRAARREFKKVLICSKGSG